MESSAEGIVTTVKHPVKTARAIAEINPQEVADALFNAISDEVIHGDEQIRARFLGRTVGEIAIGALTTKGLGAVKGLTVPNKAADLADVAKAAGKVGKAIEGVGDAGKIITEIKYKPSCGVVLKANPDKTTTILGTTTNMMCFR